MRVPRDLNPTMHGHSSDYLTGRHAHQTSKHWKKPERTREEGRKREIRMMYEPQVDTDAID